MFKFYILKRINIYYLLPHLIRPIVLNWSVRVFVRSGPVTTLVIIDCQEEAEFGGFSLLQASAIDRSFILKLRRRMGGGNNINSVFYAESYHPIQAGSIDGTDVLPHDNAVYRALLCSSAGLCILFVGALPFSLEFSTHFWFSSYPVIFAQMTHLAILRP